MDTIELAKLKEDTLKWIEKARINGRLFTTYQCTHCNAELKTPKPKRGEVAGKGYWNSLKSCYECGHTNFVVTYPSGKTLVTDPQTI